MDNWLAILLAGGGLAALAKLSEVLITRYTASQTMQAKVSGDATDDERDDFDTVTDKLGSYVAMVRADYERERERRLLAETRLDERNAEVTRLRHLLYRLTIALRDRLPQMIGSCPHSDPNCPGQRFAAGLSNVLDEADAVTK